jgi:thiosulfate dehydrogenase [quinone] large subunit
LSRWENGRKSHSSNNRNAADPIALNDGVQKARWNLHCLNLECGGVEAFVGVEILLDFQKRMPNLSAPRFLSHQSIPLPMSEPSCPSPCCPRFDLAAANLITRLWVGMRLFMAGLDKFRSGDGAAATFNMGNYETKTGVIAKLMSDNSFLPAVLPGWAIDQYAHSIGFILLLVGLWVVIGLFSEWSLLAAGLTFLSLGFGLAALPDDTEMTVNIGIGIAITFLALSTVKHGYLSLDGLLRQKKSGEKKAEA